VTRRPGRRPWEVDLARRQPRTPAEAADRAHRGAAMVRAALAGDPVPEEVTRPADPPPPAGYELVGCLDCYRPVWGLPGSRCPACQLATAPQRGDIG
jgi:hypothetical protein